MSGSMGYVKVKQPTKNMAIPFRRLTRAVLRLVWPFDAGVGLPYSSSLRASLSISRKTSGRVTAMVRRARKTA